MKDINGNIFRMRVYGNSSAFNLNVSALNNTAQIGKGTTPPNNNDFKIENPFTNGGGDPVDTPQTSLTATYALGSEKVEMITTMVAQGAGTLTEVCKFVICNDDGGVDRICLVMRDVITPKAFIGGETINILHQVST